MPARPNEQRRGDCLAPTALHLLGNPLDFIHEDHLREREICAMLDRIAGDQMPAQEDVDGAAGFLAEELPAHIADEEEDLFPLLRQRCAPEDEIGPVLARLHADHGHADFDTPRVALLLRRSGEGLEPDARESLRRFARHARRHLVLENAIILPFARLRLTKDDLETLCRRMMQRRGLDRLMEADNAERPS